jgi:hypothetical protein
MDNMQISAPFGYRSVVTYLREQRVRLPAPGVLPDFALSSSALPLTYSEIPEAGRDYPVIFIQNPQTSTFSMLGVLGVEQNENLYAPNLQWENGIYLPAYVRRYPFCMTHMPNAPVEQQRIVSIESDYMGGDEGELMFDAAGQPTERWNGIFNFIQEFEADLERTQEFCSILANYKLLQPYSVQADLTQGGRVNLDGFFCVDESRLEHLTSDEIRTLIRKGAMRGIYQHLSSLPRFNHLLGRKAQKVAALGGAAAGTAAPAANEALAEAPAA